MILGPISYLDCVIFCVFLAPQLLWQAGLYETVSCALQALPFLVFELPVAFFYERLVLRPEQRTPFVQRSGPFEDVVIRCVRYAFAKVPPRVGHVFFAKSVALPFLRYRMLRHGYLRCPVHWREHRDRHFRGLWVVKDPARKSDFVLYYVHGGGFSLGSPYFYLEFLLSWVSLLAEAEYHNPAIFALEYTHVPDARFPTQLQETAHGYRHVLTVAGDPSIVCVSGDSAGATLILSLLLYLANPDGNIGEGEGNNGRVAKPALAILISPWAALLSQRYKNSTSDYLDADALQRYSLQYVARQAATNDPLASPGSCKDVSWWRNASPSKGIIVTYGQEEVFAPEIRELTKTLHKAGVLVESEEEAGGIHAWPVAAHFVSRSTRQRVEGIRNLTSKIRQRIQ